MSETVTIKPPERRHYDKPRVPFRDQVKSLRMFDDGREIVLDRRSIAFVVAAKDAPNDGTIIGLKLMGAKPIVVRAPYEEIRKWWPGSDVPASNGKAA
jgi:hypothetical protein